MSSIASEEAELREEIALTREAIRACLKSKSYSVGNRSLVHQELADLRAHLKDLKNQLAELTIGSGPWFGRAMYRRPR